jgi:hypothetical protein
MQRPDNSYAMRRHAVPHRPTRHYSRATPSNDPVRRALRQIEIAECARPAHVKGVPPGYLRVSTR